MEAATLLFKQYMNRVHCMEILEPELIWEAITLYHEELDRELFPIGNLENLTNPLLFLTTSYVDKLEQEWIFGIAADPDNSNNWYTAVCLKNGGIIDSSIPLKI
ncbi:hypothetical protein [Lederbergia citrea]|uniref:Uncharacterized protein n=1 Tax=Lederbergia citrea TaxID=2833581 RepID=A0A942UQR1_9BACI|nr:hypothetical protein [Lederbergia citrea]MBS4223847.1 hypothetical protein [Lederbergia citrea]